MNLIYANRAIIIVFNASGLSLITVLYAMQVKLFKELYFKINVCVIKGFFIIKIKQSARYATSIV